MEIVFSGVAVALEPVFAFSTASLSQKPKQPYFAQAEALRLSPSWRNNLACAFAPAPVFGAANELP